MNPRGTMKKLFSEERQKPSRNFSQIAKTVQVVKTVSNRFKCGEGNFGSGAVPLVIAMSVEDLQDAAGDSGGSRNKKEPCTLKEIALQCLLRKYDLLQQRGYPHERVMYARKHQGMQRNPVIGGVPITEEQAIDLRQTVFGSCVAPPRGEWLRTGFVFREPDQELAYGLKAPRNGTRGLLSVVQAHIIKYFLFEKKGFEGQTPEKLLKPTRNRQVDALWTALASIIWTIGEKKSCMVCLPQEHPSLQHSSTYFADGLTEFLYLFEFSSLDDLQIFIKRYVYLFLEDPGPGVLLLLYSAVMTRGTAKVRADMEDDKAYLVTSAEEGSNCIITLLLTGRATPYLHNGVVYVGDEDHYARPQWGVMTRSEVGFLFHDESSESKNLEECKQPGSRLKTPRLPVWVVNCSGHYAVLFNTNSELLRNYHAERRFDLYYYSIGGSHSLLSVDTRYHEKQNESRDNVKTEEPSAMTTTNPLEKLIHTKWQDAYIQWNGMVPFV